uniref:Uncharacterized protein n=1 Tax=Vespula pensylvanica TaxID=30213 RepID=A0A834PCN0_VESPE|nr:hypothetical protein H0235_003789 [Vespula pensylvanica]
MRDENILVRKRVVLVDDAGSDVGSSGDDSVGSTIIYFHIVHVGTAEALSSIVLALISRDRDGNRRKPEDRVLRVTTGVECDRVGLVQSRVQSDRIPWKWHGELLISKQRSCGMTRFYNAYISATFQIFLHCVPAICRREITSETIFLLSYVWNINNRFSLAL